MRERPESRWGQDLYLAKEPQGEEILIARDDCSGRSRDRSAEHGYVVRIPAYIEWERRGHDQLTSIPQDPDQWSDLAIRKPEFSAELLLDLPQDVFR